MCLVKQNPLLNWFFKALYQTIEGGLLIWQLFMGFTNVMFANMLFE